MPCNPTIARYRKTLPETDPDPGGGIHTLVHVLDGVGGRVEQSLILRNGHGNRSLLEGKWWDRYQFLPLVGTAGDHFRFLVFVF